MFEPCTCAVLELARAEWGITIRAFFLGSLCGALLNSAIRLIWDAVIDRLSRGDSVSAGKLAELKGKS